MLNNGLYEQVINKELASELATTDKLSQTAPINNAEVYTVDITPYSYQQEILDKLEVERKARGYTCNQLMAAMDFMKPSTVREGVKWLRDKQLDVFFVTLNKADKGYSPTTMYNDYSINESLFHWKSHSTTAENSSTGQRYIHHLQSSKSNRRNEARRVKFLIPARYLACLDLKLIALS